MDIIDIASSGTAEELQMAILEFGYDDLDNLAYEAVLSGNLDTLSFLVENGIGNIDDLIDVAEEEGRDNITSYLVLQRSNQIDNEFMYDPFSKEETPVMSPLEKAISSDDLDTIKRMLETSQTDIEEVARLSILYSNIHILKYALKRGANDFQKMIDTAKEIDRDDIVDYLESVDDRWFGY